MGTQEVGPTFGERVRAMRIERNLSQEGLASRCPSYTRAGKTTRRSNTWVSNIETGKNEPNLADLIAISDALQVSVEWLVSGVSSGDSEFVARLRGMEAQLDPRGQRAVISNAERDVEESRKRAEQLPQDETEMLRLFRIAAAAKHEQHTSGLLAGLPSEEGDSLSQRVRRAPSERIPRARASGPIDTSSFHGRLRAARIESPYSAQELAEAVGLAKAQSIYDYENPNASGSPSPEALGILAKRTGKSLRWLIYGEDDDAGESEFIATIRALEDDLDARARRTVLALAMREVEESRTRAVERLSQDEAEMLRLFRMAPAAERRSLLQAAGSPEPSQHD